MNAGTIPDRGAYGVHLGEDGPRVGELDEEMVHETRPGDNITLGASTWRVEGVTRDRVIVTPAPGEPGRLPFWRGDGPGRPIELGRAIGEFLRKASEVKAGQLIEWLQRETPLDAFGAQNLASYILDQKAATGSLPTDRSIVIERFRDELGDWRVCILTPFGSRVHAPWAMALQRMISAESGYEMQVMYTDDGIVLRFADVDELPPLEQLIPDPEEVEELITDQLAGTSLFAGLFRENAVRSLLLRRNRPGKRSPLWAQRLKAQNLLATVQKYPGFPMVMETYRQALGDVFDLPAFKRVLRDLRSRTIRIDDVETASASPFSRSLVFAYVAAYLYESDAPLAERKAQALTLDRTLLSELLGQTELRDLIDPQVLEQLEDELQFLAEGYRSRDADEAHDLLRRLGDLAQDELAERSVKDPAGWLRELETQRRIAPVRIADTQRWIAAEDAGLYRDALGATTTTGLPDRFLEPVDKPLEALVRRFARHRGPFLTRDPARRFGLREAQVEPVLKLLEQAGDLVRGEIRPGGAELDWCDAVVLRRLKRRNLARLRDEVAAVDTATLAGFLPAWHGMGAQQKGAARGTERLLEVITQLQALPLPWSLWRDVVLPARVPGFRAEMLDMLAANGAVVWVGRGASGARDGRVALYLRDQVPALLDPPEALEDPTPIHTAILEALQQFGASFLIAIETEVAAADVPCDPKALREALWDLVWAGQITNDTFGPLQELARTPRRGRRRGRRPQAVTGGRWARVHDLAPSAPDPTRQAVARTRLLLDRYGIVSRQALAAEAMPGGFGPVYKVLRELEEQGRVRRGYFVEGLPGAQFAYPGAIDRLRAGRASAEERDHAPEPDDVQLLNAMDPANPFGSQVAWPEVHGDGKTKPRRVAGAWVVLVRGRPVFYVARRGRQLLTFPESLREVDGALHAAIGALSQLPRSALKGILVIEKIDDEPARDHAFAEYFRQAGYSNDYRGLMSSEAHGLNKPLDQALDNS